MQTALNLFNQIEYEFDSNQIPGWCTKAKGADLATLVYGLRPKVICECGVFGGRSLFVMALAAKATGVGHVIAIDPWSSVASSEGYSGENLMWWSHLDHEVIYQGFLANIKRLGLSDIIEVRRQKSDDASITGEINLLHLDSQHTDMVLREIKKFGPLVPEGGLIVLDDLEWRNGADAPVAKGVELLLRSGFIELYRSVQPDGSWGVYQRVESK